MPRKSVDALSVVTPITSVPRLKPPAHLTKEQQAHFAALVAAKPADYFQAADMPLLVTLCRHLVRADEIERMFASQAETVPEYIALAQAAARESGRIAAMLTKLRLTPQARYTPDNRKLRQGAAPTPPWEVTPVTREDAPE